MAIIGFTWQLWGLHSNVGVYVAVTGLHGDYWVYVVGVCFGSTWLLWVYAVLTGRLPYTPHNSHIHPVIAT